MLHKLFFEVRQCLAILNDQGATDVALRAIDGLMAKAGGPGIHHNTVEMSCGDNADLFDTTTGTDYVVLVSGWHFYSVVHHAPAGQPDTVSWRFSQEPLEVECSDCGRMIDVAEAVIYTGHMHCWQCEDCYYRADDIPADMYPYGRIYTI